MRMAWFCIQGVRRYGEKGLRFDVSLFAVPGYFAAFIITLNAIFQQRTFVYFLWEGVRENEMKSQLECW